VSLWNPAGKPDYNRNELNIGEFYREQGRKEERQRILELMRDSTKKPSATMVKVMERIESANLDNE